MGIYDITKKENTVILKKIIALGHSIGLHYDSSIGIDNDAVDILIKEKTRNM